MKRLDGKVALITGGTSGIGLASAERFQQEGARVIVTGRNAERIAETQALLGSGACVLRSEASSLTDIELLLNHIKQEYGQLDVMFLNAGHAIPTPLGMATEAQFDEVIATNFKSIFFTIQSGLPLLKKGASIIVTTSITNQTGSPVCSIYGAAKAALRSMVRSLSLSLVQQGIRINAISPGPIDTGGFNRLDVPKDIFNNIKADIEGRSPMHRFGRSEEVANVALFLASDESSYIVGEEIIIDGAITQVCVP